MIKKVLITTGDKDGVGLEVTLKALSKISKPDCCYIFFADTLYFAWFVNACNNFVWIRPFILEVTSMIK